EQTKTKVARNGSPNHCILSKPEGRLEKLIKADAENTRSKSDQKKPANSVASLHRNRKNPNNIAPLIFNVCFPNNLFSKYNSLNQLNIKTNTDKKPKTKKNTLKNTLTKDKTMPEMRKKTAID